VTVVFVDDTEKSKQRKRRKMKNRRTCSVPRAMGSNSVAIFPSSAVLVHCIAVIAADRLIVLQELHAFQETISQLAAAADKQAHSP
jgi:hypothetical protein